MAGLFINSKEAKYWMYGISAIAVLIWIIVLVGSFEGAGWFGTYGGYLGDYAGLIIGAVLLIGVIIAVVAANSTGKSSGEFSRQVYHADEKD